jgi:tetratricopeptide (TPR) repeat protein
MIARRSVSVGSAAAAGRGAGERRNPPVQPRSGGCELRAFLRFAAVLCLAACAFAQPPDAAYKTLTQAFDSLRNRDYDAATSSFRQAADLAPSRADIRKNLAYTLLKTGDSDGAREQFGEAARLDPADEHVALEYAFLCFEARDEAPARKAEARRIFARVRDGTADPALRATASQAFDNIDRPLAEGIARWRKVLAESKPTFSALHELAELAEARDLADLAAASYRAAFDLQPGKKSVLLELARAEKARGNPEGAMAALLAASRGGEPRAAEMARERLPERYPYVYEFRNALEIDPDNSALHRELAWLLLRMSESSPPMREDAEKEFRSLVNGSPDDYLATAQLGLLYLEDRNEELAMPLLKAVLAHADSATANRARMALHMPLVLESRQTPESALGPRILGERSYNAGFLKDALRYFTLAHEDDPGDDSVGLKLGWTYNLLHDDVSALHWFDIARRSSDIGIAAEAERAYRNLRPGVERFRTTVWLYPLYLSRWNDLFGYGQAKVDMRLKKLPFRPYLSVRFVGDVRRTTELNGYIETLSESAFVFAAGVATQQFHGAMAWFEAGGAVSYLTAQHWRDLRGGVSFARTLGASLAAERPGLFFESADDSVYVSHFDNDLINYSQNKFGYTSVFGGFRLQTFWNDNLTFDAKRQYWASFVETGPGAKFRLPFMPASMWATVGAVRGVYLVNAGNPHRPNFNDFRIGVWYAFTR